MTRHPATLFIAGLLLAACSKTEAGEGPKKSPRSVTFPVEVAPVEARRVEYTVFAVGSVEAFEQVQVTARVTGVVDRVRFTEGETVAKGAVLAEIDPDRYRIAVDAARAALDKAEAAEPDLKAALSRRQALVARTPGALAEEDLQSYQTRAKVAQAECAQARAALALAEVNLRDAYVRAPVAGTLQTRTVQTGQYVELGTVLGTLLRRDPLLLRFEVPEQDAPRLKVGMTALLRVAGSAADRKATLAHVAGAASATSRMVAVVAKVDEVATDPSPLRPGSFAEVRVRTGEASEAPAVPQTAIRPSERGFLAFVVEGETARERVLTLGMRTEDGRVEVKAGLTPGERLVVRGAEALKEGSKVRLDAGPVAAPASAPAPAPAPKAAP
ncbi:MAG TPA: efflux RND transporter periplasmic adaptor subunit [Myxococcales bacterium]|jgi:RND family efflux transporter MFP subunit